MPSFASASASSSSSSSSRYRDWADLPWNILTSIAKRLYTIDHIQFSAVCNSWYHAATSSPKSKPLAPRMPYLLIPDGEQIREEYGESCALLNLAENHLTHRISPLPELRGKWCIGSQFGWIFTLDEYCNVSLLDPLTPGSQINLPPLSTFRYIKPTYDSHGSLSGYLLNDDEDLGTLNFYPNEPPLSDYSLKQFRPLSMHKVVLSSSPSSGGNYVVVALFSVYDFLLFIRPGEEKWSLLDGDYFFYDVIYHDEKFIALTISGHIASFDMYVDPPKKSFLFKESSEDYFSDPEHGSRHLVVDASGDLLQVLKYGRYINGIHKSRACRFEIMRFDTEEASWSPVESLGEQSIFLGNSYSMSISAHEIPGLKTNCIYYIDDAWTSFDFDLDKAKEMERVGIFNLDDESVERFNLPNNLQLKWPPPVFITPTVR